MGHIARSGSKWRLAACSFTAALIAVLSRSDPAQATFPGANGKFAFTLTCQTTTETNIGSTCSATTTADAVMPGVVREGKRSVWGLGQVKVFDGGADADTTGDNTLFLTQGLLAP
jgi:hypothetical protein